MDIRNSKTGFRNTEYAGGGETDITNIMLFEVLELGNTDIFDTLAAGDLIADTAFISDMKRAAAYIEDNGGPGYYDTDDYTDEDHTVRDLINKIPDKIKETTGKTINFGLWLANKDSVIKNYEGTPQNMLEYPTSDIIVSYLGEQGALFGYTTLPEPL